MVSGPKGGECHRLFDGEVLIQLEGKTCRCKLSIPNEQGSDKAVPGNLSFPQQLAETQRRIQPSRGKKYPPHLGKKGSTTHRRKILQGPGHLGTKAPRGSGEPTNRRANT